MRGASQVAVVATFTALIVGSDFALAPFVSFKLLDAVVFVAAFAFGFRTGAVVAVLSEAIWSVASPWGAAGLITPFLVGGELVFAAAGWASARVWRPERGTVWPTAVFMGATLALCAFIWDFETNAVTALIWYWPALTIPKLLATELAGFVFPWPLAHEVEDLFLGIAFAPAAILAIPKVRRGS